MAYLSARQAAEALSVSDKTIRQWIAGGRLRAERRGGVWRILQADLAPLAADLAARADPEPAPAPPSPLHPRGESPAAAAPAPVDLAPLAQLIASQQQTITELAGRVGFYQARLQDLEARLLLAPPPPDPAPPTATPRRWWRLFR